MGTGSGNAFITFGWGGVSSQQIRTTPGGTATVLFNTGTSTSFIGQSSGATVTVGPGVTLGGPGNAAINLNGMVNQGVLDQSTSGRSYTVNVTSFSNDAGGAVNVSQANGASPGLTITTGSLGNAGTMTSSGSGLLQLSSNTGTAWTNTGTIQAIGGGTIELAGSGAGVGAGSGITTASFDTLNGSGGTLRLAAGDRRHVLAGLVGDGRALGSRQGPGRLVVERPPWLRPRCENPVPRDRRAAQRGQPGGRRRHGGRQWDVLQ